MRKIVIDRLPLIGYTIKEKNIDLNKLLRADEIFITNSVSGIRFVKSIKGQTWRDDQLTSLLHKQIGI
jgi:branched-subunit amino acid aminotransferase/4-amino-4-deoxychorismate lyase